MGPRLRGDDNEFQSNKLDTNSSAAVRLIASAISEAIDSVRMLVATRTASVGWIESVITSSFKRGAGDARGGAAGEHAVGDVGVDVLGAVGEQRVGGVHQRAAGIDDVVDQDAGIAGDNRRSRSSPRIRRRVRGACR